MPVGFWIVATVIAATLERWWFPRAWDETALQASRFYFGDTRAFLGYAAALDAGEQFDNGIPFHPPGWPLVLALLFRVFGWSADALPDPLLLKHVGAVMSGTSVGLAALLAYTLGGRSVMILTSLLGIFHFGHTVQAAAPNSEPLYGLLMVSVLLGVIRTRIAPWIPGMLAGFATLVRVEFWLCAALLAIWLLVDQEGVQRPKRVAIFIGAFLLTLLPSTVVNWRSIDEFNRTRQSSMPGPLPRFAPVTSYGAFNFANANHQRAEGGFNWDLPSLTPSDDEAAELLESGLIDLARPPVYGAYVDGYRLGATWLLSNPASAIRLMGQKLSIMVSAFDYGYLLDNVPVGVRGTRRPVDQIDLQTSWLTAVHAALVIIGLAVAATKPATRVLFAPVMTLLAATLLFFGYVRLGVAYLPILWILQAIAVTRILSAIPVTPHWRRRAEFAAVGLAALLLLAQWSAMSRPRVLMMDGVVDEEGRLVEDQKIEIVRVR